MTNPNETLIVLVLDRSGSMHSIKSDMEGAISEFFIKQAELPGHFTTRVVLFDDAYDDLGTFDGFEGLEIKPRGMTALYDALGKTINTVGRELADLDESERPGLVQFVIITDGMENASKEFSSAEVKRLITHQTDKYNWDFVFVGSNQNAVLTATHLGINAGSALTYDNSTIGAASASWGEYVTTTRSFGAGSAVITPVLDTDKTT